jgi:RNA polymerase sigma-70 factor (ECF subfamily)
MSDLLLNPDQWVNNYADDLYRFSLQRVSDSGLAEDIVQETFLSAWKARATFKGEASERSWLFTICKNKIIDYYRRKKREILESIQEISSGGHFFDDSEHWIQANKPGDWGIEYQQRIDNKEFYIVLERCKNKLQHLQRTVFSMKYIEDIDSAEICKVLGITSANYWVLIHRAKLQMRACLEKNWINIG